MKVEISDTIWVEATIMILINQVAIALSILSILFYLVQLEKV